MTDLEHEGRCELDYDTTRKWLVCAKSKAHATNLDQRVNRKTAILALYHAGQLREHGWAWNDAREWEKSDGTSQS